jgi:hypothetical protein
MGLMTSPAKTALNFVLNVLLQIQLLLLINLVKVYLPVLPAYPKNT